MPEMGGVRVLHKLVNWLIHRLVMLHVDLDTHLEQLPPGYFPGHILV